MPEIMTLERLTFTNNSTIGEIHLDGTKFCYSIELSCRKANSNGKMAIPCGRYEITMTHSDKFGRSTPEIMDVPGRTGIRFHSANYASQLEGCIAPGMRFDIDAVYDSRKAMSLLQDEIDKRLAKGRLFISVLGGGPSA